VFRHVSVDFVSVGLRNDARTAQPEGRDTNRLRGAKLVAALALAALVGAGSYTATYRALIIISTPSALAPTHAPADSSVATTAPSLSRSGV
jgi:hypothetical protein